MKKRVAKSLLAIGLSFSVINCGSVDQPHWDDDTVNAKTMRTHVVIADSVRPVATKIERLEGADAGVTYQLLETHDFEPRVDIDLDSESPIEVSVDLPGFADGMLGIADVEPVVNALEFDESVEVVTPDRFWQAALAVEGVYELNRHEISLNACDPSDAESLEGLESFAVLKAQKMNDGTPYLMVVSGSSVADAEVKVEHMEAGQAYRSDFSFIATELGLDGFFRGQTGVAGFPTQEGTCDDGSVTETVFGISNGALKLEARKVKVKDAEQTINGECAIELTLDASQESACSSLQVLTGELVEAL